MSIDVTPTILDEVAGLPVPAFVHGVQQKPLEGVSMAYTFDAATAHVPNALTYTAIVAGLSISALAAVLGWAGRDVAVRFLGAAGPNSALLGVLLGAGISAVCMMFAGMGGGDAKMLIPGRTRRARSQVAETRGDLSPIRDGISAATGRERSGAGVVLMPRATVGCLESPARFPSGADSLVAPLEQAGLK